MKNTSPFKEIVAVYGTLRPGYNNYRNTELDTQRYLGDDKTLPCYEIEDWGGFPGVFLWGNKCITVSLFEVTDINVWNRLDRLEGHKDNLKVGYHREEIITVGGVKAWMYIYYGNERPDCRLSHGDWKLVKYPNGYNDQKLIINLT